MRFGPIPGAPVRRVVLILAAAAALAAVILVLGRRLTEPPGSAAYASARAAIAPGEPISAEAGVFRTRPGDLAVKPDSGRRRPAHPRTLATFRTLRAYPGAPPRIPHGLTGTEFRDARCNACHERGGYVARFAAYAPVTPHPEYTNCLQCHVADANVVGIALPGPGVDATCRQCHVPGAATPDFVALDWRPAVWPETGRSALPDGPPPVPHDLQLRGNCLACHAGPGAAAEIRTSHPERANCRQCHVQAVSEDFVSARPADGNVPLGGGYR